MGSVFIRAVPQGQARKSLWIETGIGQFPVRRYLGQARKSLWIETTVPDMPPSSGSRSGS